MPIIREVDAAAFLSGERHMDEFVSLPVAELKVICTLLKCESVTNCNNADLLDLLKHRMFPELEGESGAGDILLLKLRMILEMKMKIISSRKLSHLSRVIVIHRTELISLI